MPKVFIHYAGKLYRTAGCRIPEIGEKYISGDCIKDVDKEQPPQIPRQIVKEIISIVVKGDYIES